MTKQKFKLITSCDDEEFEIMINEFIWDVGVVSITFQDSPEQYVAFILYMDI